VAKERKSFLLRVDPKLHDALRRWADDELRSLNAQVESLLRQAVQKAGRLAQEQEKPPESGSGGRGGSEDDRGGS
jgi:hypothetical protein